MLPKVGLGVVVAICCLVTVAAPAADDKKGDDKGWVSLFNGKDLSGWKTHPDDKAKWEVKDGVIVGTGPVGHLYTEKGDYENFHFKIEAKINDKGNSGQYSRTQFGKGFPKGYEAQINVTHGDPIKTGSLYPAFNPKLSKEDKDKIIVKEAPHKVDEWFTQEVIMDGNHIIILVNGNKTVDFVDSNNTFTKGHFAIQQHDPGTVIMVRKALVKELPAK
jgi:hypothetical protein